MEMDTSSWNAGTLKDLRTAFKDCVRHSFECLDVNSEYRRIQVKSVESAVLILLTSIIQIKVLHLMF